MQPPPDTTSEAARAEQRKRAGLHGALLVAVICVVALTLVVAGRARTRSAAAAGEAAATRLPDMRLDLNAARVSDLRELPGIGPALAQRIVDHREAHGPFSSLEALTVVEGVGDKTLERIRPFVVVVE